MKIKGILGGTVLMSLVSLSGCFAPEYSHNYISPDEKEFEQYKNEASKRPSPPNRSSAMLGDTKVFITYCQPGVKERTIWGDLVDYDEIWRTGANEATVFSTLGDVMVNGQKVMAGNYALYTIPSEDKWTVILNTKYDVWGAYDYEIEKDVLRFEVVPTTLTDMVELMTFNINDSGQVDFAWEKLGFSFEVKPI